MNKQNKKINRRISKIMKLRDSESYSDYIKAGKLFSKLRKDYPGIELKLY